MIMVVSVYENMQSMPKRVMIMWNEFVRKLAYNTRTNATSKDGPAWSPTDIDEGCARTNANVKAITACVFDVEKADLKTLTGMLTRLSGYAFVLHSTYSHQDDNICLRLIVPVSRPILPDEHRNVRVKAAEKLGITLDLHTNDLSRIWYLPTSQANTSPIFGHNDGQTLDVDALLVGV